MEIFYGISTEKLEALIRKIKSVRIAFIGDICLDVYWKADMTKSELSRETPHYPLPVVEERMYPGAGGNAAANAAALEPERVKLLGVVGKDWRGDVLVQKLGELHIDTDGIVASSNAVTNAYCKPIRKGISNIEYEDPRIDFGNQKDLSLQDETELIHRLDACIGNIDILCVSDQLPHGCITERVREKIIAFAKQGLTVVVDSRDRIGLYKGVILKPNEVEGMRAVRKGVCPDKVPLDEYACAAQTLAKQTGSRVCMTLGPDGCMYADLNKQIHIPSYEVAPPIDICGAGDTFMAAFSCALAAGVEPWEAASFANTAADVTIKKVGITGTARCDEIASRHLEIRSRK